MVEIEERVVSPQNLSKYSIENLKISREFSKEVLKEMNKIIRSIVLFGSSSKNMLKPTSDIDILIILNNITVFVTEELREAYRVVIESLREKISLKLHILTINLSEFWDMSRNGDPLLINILRSGTIMFDRDLVEPMQYLLKIGKIKPTKETVFNYLSRSKTLFEENNKHLQNGILDMYYSIIDITHSCLIVKKIVPQSPEKIPEIFKKEFKGTKLEKYNKTIKEIYILAKQIEHSRNKNITANQYGILYNKTKNLIRDLEKFIEKNIDKIFDI